MAHFITPAFTHRGAEGMPESKNLCFFGLTAGKNGSMTGFWMGFQVKNFRFQTFTKAQKLKS
jgi:hypothetical protein